MNTPPFLLLAFVIDAIMYRDSPSEKSPTNVSSPPAPPPPPSQETDWSYTYPDMSEKSAWYQQRVRNLNTAIRHLPNKKQLFSQGIEALRIHRENYTDEGIKRLQLLWWEWPRRHWQVIREGFPMNFLQTPSPTAPDANQKNALTITIHSANIWRQSAICRGRRHEQGIASQRHTTRPASRRNAPLLRPGGRQHNASTARGPRVSANQRHSKNLGSLNAHPQLRRHPSKRKSTFPQKRHDPTCP